MSRTKRPGLIGSFVIAMLLILAGIGCDDDPETGRVHMVLGDEPFPTDLIESARIIVESVSINVTDSDDDGWTRYAIEDGDFDLLLLQNGITAELVDAELPAGNLQEVRLVVESGEIELKDGRTFTLKIPSGSSSGLKVKIRPPIVIVPDETVEVLLDVDVSRSFKSIPASPRQVDDIESFQFHPVVRAANLATTGSVAGYVFSTEGTEDVLDDLPLEGASIMVYTDSDTSAAIADAEGFYRVMGLAPHVWNVTAEAIGFVSASTDVEVIAGIEAEVDTLRLSPQ